MSVVRTDEGTVVLIGICALEDAEPLLRLLAERPEAVVDWRRCEGMHAAVLQVLMAARRRVLGPSQSGLLDFIHVESLEKSTHVP